MSLRIYFVYHSGTSVHLDMREGENVTAGELSGGWSFFPPRIEVLFHQVGGLRINIVENHE